jgi:hypothetical protein
MPALKRLRQEDLKFEVSLGYIARPCLKSKNKNNKKNKMQNAFLFIFIRIYLLYGGIHCDNSE